MSKITIDNITKVSEDLLVEVINTLPETHPLYDLIEAELERRGDLFIQSVRAKQEKELNRLKKTFELRNKIHEEFGGFNGRKTLLLIGLLGEPYMDRYTICEETFLVVSHANPHHIFGKKKDKWQCESLEKANAKKAILIYYTIYNHHIRHASFEELELLYKKLTELAGGE